MSFLPDPFYELVLKNPFYLVLPLIIFILWTWLTYKTLYAPIDELTNFENDKDTARKRWINLLKKQSFKSFYLSRVYWLVKLSSHYSFEDDLNLIEKGRAPSIFTSESLSTFLVISSLFPVFMFFIGYIFFDIGSYLGMEILIPLGLIMKIIIILYIFQNMQKAYVLTKYPDIEYNRKTDRLADFFNLIVFISILITLSYKGADDYFISAIFIVVFFSITINYTAQLFAGAHPESLLLLLAYPLLVLVINIVSKYISNYVEGPYLAISLMLSFGLGSFFIFNKYSPLFFDWLRDRYIYNKPIRFTLTYLFSIILFSSVVVFLFRDSGYYDVYFSIIVYILIPISLAFFSWISFSMTRFFIIKIYISKHLKKSFIMFCFLDLFLMFILVLFSLFFNASAIGLINDLVCYDVIDLYAILEGMKIDSSDSDFLLILIMTIPIFLPTLVHVILISASFVLWLPERFRVWVCKNFYTDKHAKLMMCVYISVAPVLAILGPTLFIYYLINAFSLDYFESLIESLNFNPHYPIH